MPSLRSFATALTVCLAARAATSLLACSSEDAVAPARSAGDAGTVTSDANELPAADAGTDAAVVTAPFHIVGRVDTRDPRGPRFSWSGTQIRANFTGTGLVVKLTDSKESQFDVSIDGAKPTLLVPAANESHELAAGLAPGEHTVVLTKRTEPLLGSSQFLGFAPKDGALVPTAAPGGKLIEMVGDSITAGYGILGFEPCAFGAATESEPAAWGALAAAELGARHHVVAWSGIGVYRSYDGDTNRQMPVLYDRALADDAESAWDHANVHPDLVVVNLGTNDFAKGDPGQPFQTAYVAFLEAVRQKHPAAHIAVATSPMLGGDLRTKSIAALEAVVSARKAAGDAKVSLLTIDEQLSQDLYGCDKHPSQDTAKKMAAKLVAFARGNLGW